MINLMFGLLFSFHTAPLSLSFCIITSLLSSAWLADFTFLGSRTGSDGMGGSFIIVYRGRRGKY